MIPVVSAIVLLLVAPVLAVAWWHGKQMPDTSLSFIPTEFQLESHYHPSFGSEFWVYRVPACALSTDDIGSEFQLASERLWNPEVAIVVRDVRHGHGKVVITAGQATVTYPSDTELYLRPINPKRMSTVRYLR